MKPKIRHCQECGVILAQERQKPVCGACEGLDRLFDRPTTIDLTLDRDRANLELRSKLPARDMDSEATTLFKRQREMF